MPDHQLIYQEHAEEYERLISREDYQGRLLPALQGITGLEGKDVVELGAGTGRLTCLLARRVRSIRAFDASQAMLEVARRKLEQSGLRNWRLEAADHRHIPAPDGCAEIAIAGWSLCYLVDWSGAGWRAAVEQALAEMRRMLRTGGTLIVLETLGTGFETPHAPDNLQEYYNMLDTLGFSSTWVRTDYQFTSPSEAVELTRFFFGEELAGEVEAQERVILPECTGIWRLNI